MSDEFYQLEINLVRRTFPINEDPKGVLVRQAWTNVHLSKDNIKRNMDAVVTLLRAHYRDIGDFTVPKISEL